MKICLLPFKNVPDGNLGCLFLWPKIQKKSGTVCTKTFLSLLQSNHWKSYSLGPAWLLGDYFHVTYFWTTLT